MIQKIWDIKKAFHKASLEELHGDYVSPGRGWYHIYTFQLDRQDEEQLRWLPFEEKESLILLRLDIGAFRDCEIDDETLAFTERILMRFAEAGKDIILRILYDTEGKGLVREPASFGFVCEHIQSLGKIVAQHASKILLVQGLLIGSWGEMHDSNYLDSLQIKELWQVWNQATAGKVPLAVRKPVYARMIGKDACIGLYDDAMLADETHMGTFGIRTQKEASFTESWCSEDEYTFIHKYMNQVPIGGEVLGGEPMDSEATIKELRRLPVTYLNSIYHPDVLDRWKKQTLRDGQNLYQFVGDHMGYRFVVRDVSRRMGKFAITIENDGFAPLYEAVSVELIAEDTLGHRQSQRLDINLPAIKPGTKNTFYVKSVPHVENMAEIGADGGSQLYLKAMRSRDGKAIRFANEGAAEQLRIGWMSK